MSVKQTTAAALLLGHQPGDGADYLLLGLEERRVVLPTPGMRLSERSVSVPGDKAIFSFCIISPASEMKALSKEEK